MRRQSIIHFILSLIVLVLGSCTLSMEEWVLPEEKRGVDEPYTIKSDVAEVTYKFNEGVKPITENVMEYFVASEADTILYFSDNCPKEWLPEVGGCALIGCNMEFPLGYAARVLERTRTNGMIRLVTTSASENDIFDDLDYVIDTDYATTDIPEDYDPDDYEPSADDSDDDESGISDVELSCRRRISRASYEDKTYLDYSLVKDECPELYEWQMQKHFPKMYRKMRAESGGTGSGDKEEGNADNDYSSTFHVGLKVSKDKVALAVSGENTKNGETTIKLSQEASTPIVDYSKGFAQLAKEALEEAAQKSKYRDLSASPYVDISWTRTSNTHYHAEHSKKKDYQESWNEEVVENTISATVGFDVSGKICYPSEKFSGDGDLHDILTSAAEILNEKNKGSKDKSPRRHLFGYEKTLIVVPTLALVVKGKIEGGICLSLSGSGTFSSTRTTIDKTGAITRGEKTDSINVHTSTGFIDGISVDFTGELDLAVYGALNADAIFAETLGIGAEFYAAAGFSVHAETGGKVGNTNNKFFSDKNLIHPYVKVGGKLYYYVSPLGFEFLRHEVPVGEKDFLKDINWYMDPSFPRATKLTEANLEENEIGTYFTGEFSLGSTGLARSLLFVPHMHVFEMDWTDVYNGKPDHAIFNKPPLIDVTPTAATKTARLKENHTYKFKDLASHLNPHKAHVAVPCLYNPSTRTFLYYPQYGRQMYMGDPDIIEPKIIQTQGRKLTHTEKKQVPASIKDNARLYEYAIVLYIANGRRIKSLNFGTLIVDDENGTNDERKVFNQTITDKGPYASGYYIYKFKFIYNPRKEGDPLYLDCDVWFDTIKGESQKEPVHLSEKLSGDMPESKSVGYKGEEISIPIQDTNYRKVK